MWRRRAFVGLRSMSWNTQPGASGPWPTSRYISGGNAEFTVNVTALVGGEGSPIQASDTLSIVGDDLLGNLTRGGDYCLDLVGVMAACSRTRTGHASF
jgi:hypothetical protein